MVTDTKQDDVKTMTAEYVKGATIADLAVKYGYSEQEVTDAVTSEPKSELLPTQSELDAQDSKKGK